VITTYPPAVVAANQDPEAFLSTRAEGNEKQKAGAQREYFKPLEDTEQWAAEHRFKYPGGANANGAAYAAGFAVHRYYLVDTSVVALFVDVSDAAYEANPQAIDESLQRFFASLAIQDQ
jgi:hypothetical protein